LKPLTRAIETLLGYQFKDVQLLKLALTHDSKGEVGKNFERLEFIGDACLSMVISNALYDNCDFSEGKMSKMRALLVRKETLAEIMRGWSLESYYTLGKSMKTNALPDTIYADFFESLLGAIYKDSEYDTLRQIILTVFSKRIEELINGSSSFENAKSKLQEYIMSKKLSMPNYTILNKTGSAHDPLFNIKLKVLDKEFLSSGHSIKVAEMQAAEEALDFLNI